MPDCPNCTSARTVKNGHIHNGKQRFLCQECGRQFVAQRTKKVIDQARRELIDRLLLERISLAGIARAVQVSQTWLQQYVNEKYAGVQRGVEITPKKKGKLIIQCDELWSFVDNKGNKQWVWLALDSDTREIVGCYISARDEGAARQLWNSLPTVYRQCAIAYTDFWAAYAAVLPSKRHPCSRQRNGQNQLR
jgi:IS1 family transposase/transposase-like protein